MAGMLHFLVPLLQDRQPVAAVPVFVTDTFLLDWRRPFSPVARRGGGP